MKTTQQAVALEYGEHKTPIVVARGEADLAQEIIRYAEENGIWIAQDPQLVALLSRVDVNREIPPELYTTVAVVLSWVYWLRGLNACGHPKSSANRPPRSDSFDDP